jgi:hypothetical protein
VWYCCSLARTSSGSARSDAAVGRRTAPTRPSAPRPLRTLNRGSGLRGGTRGTGTPSGFSLPQDGQATTGRV